MATVLSYDQAMRLQASARIYQKRYDDALSPWAMRAPGMTLGEDITDYRAKLAILAKKQLPPDHQMRKVQYRRLDSDVFDNFEPQLLRAVHQAAYDPNTVEPGQFRMVPQIDPSGLTIRTFVGPESFVKQMGRPGGGLCRSTLPAAQWTAAEDFFGSSRQPISTPWAGTIVSTAIIRAAPLSREGVKDFSSTQPSAFDDSLQVGGTNLRMRCGGMTLRTSEGPGCGAFGIGVPDLRPDQRRACSRGELIGATML